MAHLSTYAQDDLPAWKTLAKQFQCPEWFRDAKFGIYTHWTPTTIGNELVGCGWYPYYMYQKDSVLDHGLNKIKDGPHQAYLKHVGKYPFTDERR